MKAVFATQRLSDVCDWNCSTPPAIMPGITEGQIVRCDVSRSLSRSDMVATAPCRNNHIDLTLTSQCALPLAALSVNTNFRWTASLCHKYPDSARHVYIANNHDNSLRTEAEKSWNRLYHLSNTSGIINETLESARRQYYPASVAQPEYPIGVCRQ